MKALYRFLINTLPRPLLIRLSYVFRLFAPLLYGGNQVECPVCGRSFRKFLNYGSKAASRDNVLCPHCLSLERHRLLWLYLRSKTGFFSAPQKVLHIAPEQCFHKRFKKLKNLDYTTADLESPIADLHFDLHHIPLQNDRYDVIFCNHVMEHVEDDLRCMKELHRVLKKGGWAIIQSPIDGSRQHTYEDSSIKSPVDREREFWQKDHVRLYGLDYPLRLEKAGFTVERSNFVQELKPGLAERFRLQLQETIYVCRKN